jgi:hypothetical protein
MRQGETTSCAKNEGGFGGSAGAEVACGLM